MVIIFRKECRMLLEKSVVLLKKMLQDSHQDV